MTHTLPLADEERDGGRSAPLTAAGRASAPLKGPHLVYQTSEIIKQLAGGVKYSDDLQFDMLLAIGKVTDGIIKKRLDYLGYGTPDPDEDRLFQVIVTVTRL